MGSTKFVVVKAKELIKTAVFAILGVVIILGLIMFFLHLGNAENTGLYQDGTYYGQMQTGNGEAKISVQIKDGKIAKIATEEPTETITVFYPHLENVVAEVGKKVVETQALTVEVSPEQTHSAQLVLDTVADCLEKAKK